VNAADSRQDAQRVNAEYAEHAEIAEKKEKDFSSAFFALSVFSALNPSLGDLGGSI
jgi:hypothetical protein